MFIRKIIFGILACSLGIFGLTTCGKPLSKQDAANLTDKVYTEWITRYQNDNGAAWTNKEIVKDSLSLKFEYKIFGEAPSDGRSLYISLHGGGKTPEEVNNQQWKNQISLYTPSEGLYIAPRAPWNDWNMWFKPGIDDLFDELIRLAVMMEGVNPDKVYLLGYSAGGDGLYRMAPRMADRWAAAAMMAGHPGEAHQVNLRNLPFMIWMGANDAAYDRNEWAKRIGQRLDSLQADDPAGYIHETHIMEEKGHWMELEDAAAIPWMAKYKRNPYPDKIVWRQEEVVLPFFYWLGVSKSEAKPGMIVRVNREGNVISILENDYNELTLYLNDDMFDLDKPISVLYGDKVIFEGKVNRSIDELKGTLEERKEKRYIFPSKLVVEKNSNVR